MVVHGFTSLSSYDNHGIHSSSRNYIDRTETVTAVSSPSLQIRNNNNNNKYHRYYHHSMRRSSSSSRRSSSSVEGDFDPESIQLSKEAIRAGSIAAQCRVLYKFTRPHTIRGTILASIGGTIRALIDTAPGVSIVWSVLIPRAFLGMIALLLGNAFIVGINQIYDENIDRMNKPFLPIASGEMSSRLAWMVVILSAILGPLLVQRLFPTLLFQLYTFGLFLGFLYSVPPFRTKKNPILAGLTIACVRGFLLNFGVYYAVTDAVGATFRWSPKVAFMARFMTIFATVIAVTKDLPDIEGDKVCSVYCVLVCVLLCVRIGVDVYIYVYSYIVFL
jgi:homogentisate solanesyltransferase